MKQTTSYQLDDQVARRIRQMALQFSDSERKRVTQGEVIQRAVKLLDAELAKSIAFDEEERKYLKEHVK